MVTISLHITHVCAILMMYCYCRDFGYIARDQSTHKHKCHVFRCQVPAQAVARALVDNHSKAKKSKHEMADLNDDPNSLYIDTSPHEGVYVCVSTCVY